MSEKTKGKLEWLNGWRRVCTYNVCILKKKNRYLHESKTEVVIQICQG